MVGHGWEEAKLHEHPNLYVESLCDLFALVWCSLSNANRLPSGALQNIWEQTVSAGYGLLLDGFSRVPFCSTEGRALMTMDLASFTSGVSQRSVLGRLETHSLSNPPPPISPLRGMSYVGMYVNVFYYPRMVSLALLKHSGDFLVVVPPSLSLSLSCRKPDYSLLFSTFL
jgi:hypothetical protein